MDEEKAVLRFLDGRTMKGFVQDFIEDADALCFRDSESGLMRTVQCRDLKALFFVRSFAGNREFHEKKTYGIRKPRGHRTFIKFVDGENVIGFIEGDVPWEKGFFLSRQTLNNMKGLFLLPADIGSNNIRIFVFAHAIKDATVVP